MAHPKTCPIYDGDPQKEIWPFCSAVCFKADPSVAKSPDMLRRLDQFDERDTGGGGPGGCLPVGISGDLSFYLAGAQDEAAIAEGRDWGGPLIDRCNMSGACISDIVYLRSRKRHTEELEEELIALHAAGTPPDIKVFGFMTQTGEVLMHADFEARKAGALESFVLKLGGEPDDLLVEALADHGLTLDGPDICYADNFVPNDGI